MRKTAITVWVLLLTSVLLPTESRSQGARSQEEDFRLQEEMLGIVESHSELMYLEFEPAPLWMCTKIGFSATGAHRSSGGRELLSYGPPITNVRPNIWSGFVGNSTFVAPCDGLYYFSITFVKDPFIGRPYGTTDDVFVYITQKRGAGPFVDKGYAWAGEGAGRRGGAYNVVLELLAGDWVQTWAHSDGIPPKYRHLMKHDFGGFLIAH